MVMVSHRSRLTHRVFRFGTRHGILGRRQPKGEYKMAIYLDSASVEDARRAAELGFVAGITTNPKLIARTGRAAEEIIPELCDVLGEGLVFYQLTAPTVEEREREAHRFAALRPGHVGLKIPCTTENLALLLRLAEDGLTCAATAVFSVHQALLACEAGADCIIPYVNRATRLLGDGLALVAEIAAVVEVTGGTSEVLAASFRSVSEVVGAVLAGADHVTVPLNLLLALGDHPLSEQAIAEFAQAGR
ncbi:MAG: transaldolase [Chloroflexota bacterium]|nr:MAG: transaldolase [Chloroflexota bacterium]